MHEEQPSREQLLLEIEKLRQELEDLKREKAHLEILLETTKKHSDPEINASYSRFVPHEFLRFLERESIVDIKLGDQAHKEMTVMFADIRSFTSLLESITPKENFDFINSYLSRVKPVIRNRNGFIDKYMGDAVMALFPGTAEDAMLAAIDMQNQVLLYNYNRQKSGCSPIAIGIGMHTGSLMLSIIGEQRQMQSKIISDAVNFASRLDSLTKLYGAAIVISGETLYRLNDPTKYNCRFLDKVKVKGRTDLVSLFEVFDVDPPHIRDLKLQTLTKFEQGIVLYHQNKFTEAYQLFKEVLQVNEQDQAAILYVKRCDKYQTL